MAAGNNGIPGSVGFGCCTQPAATRRYFIRPARGGVKRLQPGGYAPFNPDLSTAGGQSPQCLSVRRPPSDPAGTCRNATPRLRNFIGL